MHTSRVTLFGILATLVLLLVACAQAAEPRRAPRTGTESGTGTGTRTGTGTTCLVATVTDGDTLTCRDGPKVRLLLVDAPEKRQEPWGARARDALLALAPVGSTVWLELDLRPTDPYGRTLAYVWLADGRMANELLARDGFVLALTYPPNVRHVDRIRVAVENAKANRRGLWATSAFDCTPKEHRTGKCP